jgi:hypothetical protein
MPVSKYNEHVLLDVIQDRNDVIIRVDQNGLSQSHFAGAPILNLEMRECWNVLDVVERLTIAVGNPLEYKIVKETFGARILFTLNYSVETFEVRSARVVEIEENGYSADDWEHKCGRLVRLYLQSAEQSLLDHELYDLLKITLWDRVGKEIARIQEKFEYFRQSNAELAAQCSAQIQAYQNALALTGWLEGEPIFPIITEWVLSEWDESAKNPLSHRDAIRKRIVELGSSAIFPLLEMLKNPDPGVRLEAIAILEKIDPQIASLADGWLDLKAFE